MNRENNQALNSFLKNVLRAQDELKWIDSRVDGAKDPQERSPRYQRTSRRDPDPKARSKRRSGYELDENESWPSANKRKVYYEYEEAGNRAQGVYPEDETETKREAKEGPRVSEGWFEYNDDDAESLRDSRQATDLKVHNESSSTNDLESLRRTVLALSRSLEESDKKVDEMAENELRGVVEESKDRERHVGEIFERKKSRGKGAKEIEDPGDFGQAFGASSSGSSWWDDPRTAVDMFDFKRRDDDEGMDDEDEDEDSEPGMSEFDYNAMRRVKRERDNDLGEPGVIRVYNRAGFGASYREGGGGYERRKRRSGYEKDAEELEGSGNVSREISGESMAAVMRDKVINEGGDGAEMRKIVNANDRSGGQAEVVNKSEAKNSGDDSPAGGNPEEVKEIVAEDPGKQETRRNEILDDELASKNEVIKTPESETPNEKTEEAKQVAQKSQSNAYEVVKSSTDSNEVKKDEEQTKRREEETGVNGDSKTPGKVKMTDATRVEKNKESIDVKMAADNQPDSRTEKNNDESEDRKPKIQEDSKSVKLGEVKEENADNNGLHSKSDELTRKLLWLSENEESYLKNDREKFAKRSLMATKERKMRRCKAFAKTPRRSVRSYPESVEADKSMEEASREDKEDVHRSETRKRSVRRIIERRRDPDLAADVYEVEVEDDGVADQDDENDNLKESRASNDEDGEAELALVSFAGSDADRDPIRDRINMLIKQKLDDREKGKLVHVKREVNDPTRIIEYYDYDSDENVIDSEADPSLAESDQAQNSTVTGEVHGNDTAESTGGGNTIPKKDENAEEEKKQEENQNNTKIEPPKEEFISNIDTSKAETTKPPSGVDVTTVPQPAFEEGQRPYGEDRNLQDEESRNESNEHHEDRAAKSSDSRWLGESQDQDSRNEKSTDDQPFEYSVNVHGKIDPDSIGNVKDKLTGSDEDWKYEGPQDGKEVENEELDKERAARRDWRYRDSTRTEEGSNSLKSSKDSSSFSSSSSSSTDDNEREQIPEDKRYFEETGDQENLSSQESSLTDDESAGDSLRTMLDRSGSRQPGLSGERTYLVIAPAQSQCPRKTGDGNDKSASSSSGSSYSALKITDDMFKGGIEQSNPVDEGVTDGDTFGRTTTEWAVLKPGVKEEKSRYQDLVMSPLDVVHESIVDPDEMAADFDDDTKPRLGRSLQSISYAKDPFYRVEVNGNTERPVEKYLEYTQNGYSNDKVTVHRIVKRNAEPSGSDEQESSYNTSLGQLASNGSDQSDKDKRGLTNVEEWEMNAPTLQKQPEKARETRSVRLIDDSLEHNPKSVELTDEMRSKIHRGFDDPNVRDNSRESDEKWSNFRRNSIRRDHQREKFKGRESADADLSKQNDDYRRSRYNWRKSDRGLSPSRRHHLNRLKQQRGDETRDFIHEQNGLVHVARNPDESSRFKDARFVDQGKTMPFDGTKRVLDENAEDPASIKPKDDNQKKKFKVLLAADNMEDESQMDLALHGELAGKIVERIFDQVQVNNALKVALGPGLFRKHKSEDAVQTDKTYRRGLDEDEVKHTETMMRRVMELLGRLILDEVQRKTCASLPPDMREFLQWMLRVDDDDKPSEQVPPLPLVHNQEPHQHRTDKFLFGDSSIGNESAELDELNKKVRLLKRLIEEYNALTTKEKTKVQVVHDYLVKQLRLLLEYIESKQAGGVKNEGSTLGDANILQYQNAMPNPNETVTPQSTLSPLVNAPSIVMLSNATFNMDQPYRPSSNRLFGQLRPRRREARSSVRDVEKKHRKHDHKHHHTDHESNKNKKKHKHKHKKKHKLERHAGGESGAETPEYRKLIRRAAMMRRKRANLYEDAWDPVDSGYEEPVIYSASGKLTSGSGKRRRSPEEKDEVKRDVISASVALQPWLNPKSDDPMTSGYLNQLTNRLVRESLTPPVYEERKSANGRSLADDEVMLLSKREAWRNENEQQLEEVAFGKDMRGKWRDEERFKKLTDIDRKKKFDDDGIGRQKREGDEKRNSNSSNSLGSAQLSQVAKNEKVGNSTPTVNDANLVKRSTNLDNVINRNSTKAVSLQTENSEAKFLDSKLSSLVSGARNEQGLISGVHERGESQNEVDRVPRTEYKQRHSTLSRELQSGGPDQSTQNPDQKESITRKIAIIDKNSATSEEPIEKRNGKRSSPFVIPEAEGSAILPHLEVSEQRQQQKQAAKTETDDQRDIANQVLGLDNPLILGLNTY